MSIQFFFLFRDRKPLYCNILTLCECYIVFTNCYNYTYGNEKKLESLPTKTLMIFKGLAG